MDSWSVSLEWKNQVRYLINVFGHSWYLLLQVFSIILKSIVEQFLIQSQTTQFWQISLLLLLLIIWGSHFVIEHRLMRMVLRIVRLRNVWEVGRRHYPHGWVHSIESQNFLGNAKNTLIYSIQSVFSLVHILNYSVVYVNVSFFSSLKGDKRSIQEFHFIHFIGTQINLSFL